MVAAHAEHAGMDHASVGEGHVRGGAAAEVDEQRTGRLILGRQHRLGGAASGEVGVGDFKLRRRRRRARILHARLRAVHDERAELEEPARHPLGGRDAVKSVESVAEFGDVEERTVVLKFRVAGTVVDLREVVFGDGLVHLPLRDKLLDADLGAGDRERGASDGVAVLAFEALQDGCHRDAGLADVGDLALADARGGDVAVRDDGDAPGAERFGDGDHGTRGTDLEGGDGV